MFFARTYMFSIAILSVMTIAVTSPASAGECIDKHSGWNEKAVCIESKADASARKIRQLETRVSALAKKVDGIEQGLKKLVEAIDQRPTQTQVENSVWNMLDGVKIEWKAHPGVCLWFHNWNNNVDIPDNSARTALGCGNTPNYIARIRK